MLAPLVHRAGLITPSNSLPKTAVETGTASANIEKESIRAELLVGVTLVANDAKRSADFYARILGVDAPVPDANGARTIAIGVAKITTSLKSPFSPRRMQSVSPPRASVARQSRCS